MVLPDARLDSGTDLLAEASAGTITEVGIANVGATSGKSVGSQVWTSHKIPPTGRNNIDDMLGVDVPEGVIYGSVALYSPQEQTTTMYVGASYGAKVWLNGTLIYERFTERIGHDYSDFVPTTLKQGRNVLLVAISLSDHWFGNHGFFGLEPGTDYTLLTTGIGYDFSSETIHLGDIFTFEIRAENVLDLGGWQFDIAFDPALLEAVSVSEGGFLKTDGGSTFFQEGRIDNASGKITGVKSALLADSGVSGSGAILQMKFKAKSEGETKVVLQNFKFGSFSGENISAGPLEVTLTVEGRLPTGDVNRDGGVDILDLILVARQLGKRVPSDSPEDVNGDGVVNIFDLTLVAQGIGGAAAPAVATGRVDAATIEAWIAEARLTDDGSIAFAQGIQNLENLLASYIPEETALLANYPNPFNPETWIPYQLSENSPVSLSIYDRTGVQVRTLSLGIQPAGFYNSRERAAYWDGRNDDGERVASGLYFYQLRTPSFHQTRRLVIVK